MRKTLVLLVAVCVIAASQAGGSCQSSCPEALERYRQAVIAYTGKVVKTVVPKSQDGVYILSPLAVMDSLAILAMYAVGQTYTELMSILGLKSKDEINCVIVSELSLFANPPKGIDYVYAAIKAADYKYNFTDQIKQELMTLGGGFYAYNGDFSQIGNAKRQINNKISSMTENHVKNSVSQLSKNGLNIIAGQYFAGAFETPFNLNNISVAPYYGLNCKTCNVSYFYQRGTYNYAYSDVLQAELVSIPYVEDYCEALFIIPTEKDGYLSLVDKMESNPEYVQDAYNNMTMTNLDLYLPVYGNQSKLVNSRNIAMQAGGLQTVFNKKAQYKNMIVGDVPIHTQVFTQKILFSNVYESSDDSMDCGCSDDDDDSDTEYCVVNGNRLSIIYIVKAGFPLFLVYGNLPCVS